MNTNSEKDWSNIEHEVHSTNPFSYTKIPITFHKLKSWIES